jgi:hypothetical protein
VQKGPSHKGEGRVTTNVIWREQGNEQARFRNRFEPALFDLMEEAVKLQAKLSGIREAATQANAAKNKKAK